MSKKILTFLFVFFMVITFAACKKEGKITINVETTMTAGQSYQVEAKYDNLAKDAVVTWNVSNVTIASFNEETLMFYALKEGEVTLSASAEEGKVYSEVKITIEAAPVTKYTVTYNLDGGEWGTQEGTTEFVQGSPCSLVTPVKTGHKFLGWYEGETKVETLTDKNYNLVAKWIEEYTVTYNLNGGSFGSIKAETTFVKDSPFTLPTPSRNGYDFLGWYEGETKVELLSNKNYELTAQWEKSKVYYNLELVLNGGEFASDYEVPTRFEAGSKVELATPTKEGYTFLGWKLYEAQPTVTLNIPQTNNDLKLFAVWGDADYYVGAEWGYTTLAQAIEAAKDGDKIVVMPGTYLGATINKQVTIEGYNSLMNLSTNDEASQTFFTSDLIIAADNVTISGVVITGNAKFMNQKGMNIANPTIKYSIVRNSTVNPNEQANYIAPFNFTNTGSYSIKNLTILNCKVEQVATGRPMVAFLSQIDGLTIKNSSFYGRKTLANMNDAIKFDNSTSYGVKGNVTITGNHFENYQQYVIWFRSYGAGTYVIENNEFVNCGSTPESHASLVFVSYAGSESEQVSISYKYNKVTKGMMVVRIDEASALTDTNASVKINYNSANECNGKYYISNKTAITLDIENNWWGTATLDETKFLGVLVPTNHYSSADEVPGKGSIEKVEYEITYDLNGGDWAVQPYTYDECVEDLVADLAVYYEKNITATNIKDITYGASKSMADFFFNDDTYSDKWEWLADFMMETRQADAEQSSGYAQLTSEDNTTWRYEVHGFTSKTVPSWPYSSNYALPEVQQKFLIAAADFGKTVPGPEKYVPGVETALVAGAIEGKIFQYWLSETGEVYTDVIPVYCEGNLKLTAVYADEIKPMAFECTNIPENGIELYGTLQLEWILSPISANNKEVEFISADENVFTVDKNGLITAVGVGEALLMVNVLGNSDLEVLYTIKVYMPAQFNISYETESYVNIGENIIINAEYYNEDMSTEALVWESLNPEIATVDTNGTVTGVAQGNAIIRVSLESDSTKYYDVPVTVLSTELSDILKDIIDSHESNVFVKYDLGIGAGTPEYYYDVYGSVNKVLFNDDLEINDKYLEQGNNKYAGQDRTMSSIEFITVHYTGNMKRNSNASANAGYFVQTSHSTSIHYTTGNDGVFHCMDDDKAAAHAGDSSSIDYVGAFEWLDTGVAYTAGASLNPEVTVSEDYYYVIDGVKTSIELPKPYSYNGRAIHEYIGNGQVKLGSDGSTRPAERFFNDMGFKFIEKNGNYYMAKTWWCYSQISEGRICSVGGNSNSIGIESCVDLGSDLWYTWQKTAQLVAKLLVDNNLDLNRVVGHHFYTAKDCPQPMLENDLEIWYEFLALVEIEYKLLTQYQGYEIKMEVIEGSDVLANTGRVSQDHVDRIVTYKVTITNKETLVSETITLSSLVAGDFLK